MRRTSSSAAAASLAVFLGKDFSEERNYSEDAARQIDAEIRSLVDDCYARSREMLTQHRDKLDLLAETLLDRETLTQEEVSSLVREGIMPEPPAPPSVDTAAPERTDKAPDRTAEAKPWGGALPPPIPEAP